MSKYHPSPISKIRDGHLRAILWLETTDDKKQRYFIRFYSYAEHAEEWREQNEFYQDDLLKIGRLADKAYDLLLQYTKGDRPDHSRPK